MEDSTSGSDTEFDHDYGTELSDIDDYSNKKRFSFPQFTSLPPELRIQIWRAVLPAPGINFFNVHAFPGDHSGTSRIDSPPWLYLDMRRLSIEHSDEKVASYDPSVWHVRAAIRQVCREARDACAIPIDEKATVTLTRPRRGLFVWAGDEQLRWKTPLKAKKNGDDDTEDANENGDYPLPTAAQIAGFAPNLVLIHDEPKVIRKVCVHVDDIFCLSIENCSFNMPYEDERETHDGHARCSSSSRYYSAGRAYKPQLTPLPVGIPRNRYCINLARKKTIGIDAMALTVPDILAELDIENEKEPRDRNDAAATSTQSSRPSHSSASSPPSKPNSSRHPTRELMMLDSRTSLRTHSLCDNLWRLEVYYDRFGDMYIPQPCTYGAKLLTEYRDRFPTHRLTKIFPHQTDMRSRYRSSAGLTEPYNPTNFDF